jgi:outer membrane PBP1 activator LpoA protein
LLKPQLRFHYAGDIPTYATSAVYQPGTSDNGDINGIIFPDIPWLLQPNPAAVRHADTLNAYWGKSMLRLTRFFAMGYDSYHLTAMLNDRSARNSHLNMEGMTGRLRIDRQGILHRELKWARMERGTTRTLPDVPRSLMQDAEIILSQQ